MKNSYMVRTISAKYIFIILMLGLLVYANTLRNEFVSDDIPAIVNNPNISKLSLNGNLAAFSDSLNYMIGRFNPFIYHLTNIALHLANSILVFLFLRLFFSPVACFWGALVFVAHPIHTEAVTWISGKPYLFTTFFLLTSFLFYQRATTSLKVQIGYLSLSLLAFFFSLYASIFFLIFPVAIALYDCTFSRARKNWRLWLVFFTVSAIRFLFMSNLVQQRVATVAADVGQSLMSNPIFNMTYSIFSGLWLLIWPAKLTLYHEPCSISKVALISGLISLGALALLLPLILKKSKIIFFSIWIFILFLLPTYSPLQISWLVAERYLYFPSLSFSIWAAFVVDKTANTGRLKKWLNVLLIFLIILYAGRTMLRNRDWKTHASIWRATVKTSPLSPKAHNNMGDVYCQEGNFQQAVREFERAIALRPDYADAYHNLAHTYQQMGRIDEAILNYKKAVLFNPGFYQSYQNLAVIYSHQGQPNLAEEYFNKASRGRSVK